MSTTGSDETIDAKGARLVEPLLNGHTHAAMTLFRGYGGDLPLMRWLREKVWPVEERIEAEDVYWGARLACVEMICTGTARFWDMYWQPGATARAVLDSDSAISPPTSSTPPAARSSTPRSSAAAS